MTLARFAGSMTVEIDIKVGGVSIGEGSVDVPIRVVGKKFEVTSEDLAQSLAGFLHGTAEIFERGLADVRRDRREKAERVKALIPRLLPKREPDEGTPKS